MGAFPWPTTYYEVGIVLDTKDTTEQNCQKNQFEGYIHVGCCLAYSDCIIDEKRSKNKIR